MTTKSSIKDMTLEELGQAAFDLIARGDAELNRANNLYTSAGTVLQKVKKAGVACPDGIEKDKANLAMKIARGETSLQQEHQKRMKEMRLANMFSRNR